MARSVVVGVVDYVREKVMPRQLSIEYSIETAVLRIVTYACFYGYGKLMGILTTT
jgi:hypothetical protein